VQGVSGLVHLAGILVGEVPRLPLVALKRSAQVPVPWDHLSTHLDQQIIQVALTSFLAL